MGAQEWAYPLAQGIFRYDRIVGDADDGPNGAWATVEAIITPQRANVVHVPRNPSNGW